jgi:molybdate transport system substrate-binding protein
MKYLFWSVCIALILGNPSGVRAQGDLVVIAAGGGRGALEQLFTGFEHKSGYKVTATFGSGPGTNQKVAGGEAFDVAVVQSPYPDVLASGNVASGAGTPLANFSLAVGVRQGAPRPDISTLEAVKRMLLAAPTVACADASTGSAAGVSCNELIKKLGIAGQVQPKLKIAQGGGVGAMALVAKGDAEVGLAFVTEMKNSGIDVVGPLSREISPPPVLVGFVSSHTKNSPAAKALVEYLSAPEAAAVYKSQGMQPGP